MTINFAVFGNQEDTRGNPIPYTRATQDSTWNPTYRRYIAWKQFVQLAFIAGRPAFAGQAKRRIIQGGKPIEGKPRGTVHAAISFGDETRCDPDNVVKGILDSLFENDKHVDVITSQARACNERQPSSFSVRPHVTHLYSSTTRRILNYAEAKPMISSHRRSRLAGVFPFSFNRSKWSAMWMKFFK